MLPVFCFVKLYVNRLYYDGSTRSVVILNFKISHASVATHGNIISTVFIIRIIL